ncbi:YSIRK-type signal peptide-containing protein [Staphylococcus sp. EZ-P03]|uniref:GA-like domain-containing protein n=1 Tax=Staphylococcus sp. EZ-P03 TaxID=2282739 RepID=UPI000DF7DE4D|nr:YSIRK-type signal peptide-containing protein [Staphylococcus sp. EZ-P03]
MKQQSKRRLDFLPNKQNKYSIRKFTVGTASILVGATFLFGLSHEAQAAEEQTPNDVTVQSQSVNTHSNNESASQPSQETSDTAAVTPPVTTEAPASETAAPTNPNATPTTSQESTSQQKAPTSETNKVSTQTTTASQTTSSESTPVVEQQPTSETIAKPRTRRALETADTFESIPAPVNNETYNGKIIDYTGDLVQKVENPGKTVAPDYINFSPKFTNYDSKSYSFLTNGTNVTSKKLTNTNDGAIHAYLGDYITLNNTSPEAYVYINNVGIADGHKVDALVHVTRDQASTNFPTDIRYFFTSGRDMLSMTSQDGGGTTANIKFLQNIDKARLDEFYNTIQNGTSISSVVDGLNALNSEAHPVSGLLNIYDLDDYDRNKAVDVRKSVTFNRNEINELYVSNQQPFPATANLELKDGKVIISTGEQPRGGVEEYPNRVTATFQDKSELTYSMTGRNASGTAFHVKGILLVPIQPYTTQVVNPVNGTDGKVTVTQYIPTREVSQPATLPSKVEISAEFPQGISATAQPNTSDFAASQNGTNKVVLTSTTQALSKPSFYDHTYVLPITLKHELTVNDISSNSEKWLKLKEYYDGDVLNVPVKWSFDNGDKQWDNLTTDHSTVPLKLSDELKREIDKQIMAEATASVEEAKTAHAQAKEKAQAIVSDQLVNSNEATELQTSIQSATDKKSIAQEKVNQLPERLKTQLQAELDQLTPIAVPDINDKNNNNISDEQDELIAQAEALIADASKAEEAAKSALNQLNADNAISPEDNTQLTQLQNDFTEKKQAAKDKIASIQQPHQGPLTEKLNKLLGINVPEVNDRDGNGKPDDLDAQEQKNTDLLNAAADLVAKAEEADKTAQTKLQSAIDNNLITPEESTDLISEKDNAAATKTKAEEAVNALPQDMQKSLLDRLSKLHGIEVPSINDKNKNDIPDTQDELIEAAKLSIKEVQDADATAKSELATAQSDQAINPTEHDNLDRLQNDFTAKKQAATDKVNAIDSKYNSDLLNQLAALNGIDVPTVNDENNNGKPDSAEEEDNSRLLDEIRAAIEAAKNADQAAQEKLKEVKQDDVVSQAELDGLYTVEDNADNTAAEARRLIEQLPENLQAPFLEEVNALNGIEIPGINDFDNNNIPDTQDELIKAAEVSIKEAKDANDLAKAELATAQSDQLINPTEHSNLERLQNDFTTKKQAATDKVNAIDPKYRKDLPEQLQALTGIRVPEVNDKNNNGKPDSEEQQEQENAALQAATDLVEKAEQADRAAQEQLKSANTNDLITPEESASLTTAKDSASTTKSAADEAVKALPQDVQEPLLNRLNKLHGIEVPSINDKNSNSIPDDQDALIKEATKAYEYAKAGEDIVKTELAKAQADSVINPEEHTMVGALQDAFGQKKAEAESKVNAIDEKYRGELPEKVAALIGVTVPEVNDANSNGKLDSQEQQEQRAQQDKALQAATDLVEKAEAADRAAQDQLKTANDNNLITPEEHTNLTAAKDSAATTKSAANEAVKALPQDVQESLLERLNKLHGIEVPSVNDKNSNNIPDNQDELIKAAEVSIKEAQNADALAKSELATAQADQVINPTEHNNLDELQNDFTTKKQAATDKVSAIDEKYRRDLPEQLAALTGITVPKVNDANNNGQPDDAEQAALDTLLADAKAALEKAKAADQAAKAQLSEAEQDQVINPVEHEGLETAKTTAATAKSEAADKINALPETLRAPLQAELDQLNGITIPSINDKNTNQIPDDQDALIEAAKAAIQAAEAADAFAKTALNKADENQAITPEEHQQLSDLQADFVQKKAAAEQAVNAINEVLRGVLPGKLAALTGIDVPEVNDADSNGKLDAAEAQELQDALQAATELVEKAEQADKTAQDQLQSASANDLITPEEHTSLTAAKDNAATTKSAADEAVKALPEAVQGPLLERLNQLHNIQVPSINDENNNNIPDDQDELIKAAEVSIKEVQEADASANSELTKAQADQVINPTEHDNLDGLQNDFTTKKQAAEEKVNAIDEKYRKDLPEQLAALNGINVPSVNDENSNGIEDSIDSLLADAQKSIDAAKEMANQAQDKLNEAKADQLINPKELEALTGIKNLAEANKQAAQAKVNSLPQQYQAPLQAQLDQINTIALPEVNDKDANQIDDHTDELKAAVQALVDEAKAANQAAHQEKSEIEKDNLVTPLEQAQLKDKARYAAEAKQLAQRAVDMISETLRPEFQTQLDALVPVEVANINDQNSNGIDDVQDRLIEDAQKAIKAAQDAEAAAQIGLNAALDNEVITDSEQNILDALQKDFAAKKAIAQEKVDLVEDALKGDMPSTLEQLHGITVPEVNDKNHNGVDDALDAALQALIQKAEDANQDAHIHLAEANTDSLITPKEHEALVSDQTKADTTKEEAVAAVKESHIPETVKAELLEVLAQLDNIDVPKVNDANNNKIADDVDAQLAEAEELVKKAEALNEAAQNELAKAEVDQLITPSEHQALTQQQVLFEGAKAAAEQWVAQLPKAYQSQFEARLNPLHGINIPDINDQNSNNIKDSDDAARAEAEEFVKVAQLMDTKLQEKLKALTSDALITPEEYGQLAQLNAIYEDVKEQAAAKVSQLPATLKGDLPAILASLKGIALPQVNDKNHNDIDDATDQNINEANVALEAAKAADKAAKAAFNEAVSDNLVTPEEQATLKEQQANAKNTKALAQNKVDALPTELKGSLEEELAQLTGIDVPEINDANANGTNDIQDQWLNDAIKAINAAKVADQTAKAHYNEVVTDNLVTPEEQATLKVQQANAQTTKALAQNKVDALPTELKGSLEEELAQLTGIDVPEINDANANGTNDIQDQWLNDAIEAVNAAKVADQTAKEYYNEAISDNLVTPEEQATLKAQQANAKNTKALAQNKVDALPTELKGSLEGELAQLTGIVIPDVSEHHVSEPSSEVSSEENHDAASVNTDEVLNTDNHHTPSETSEVHNQSENTHVNQLSKDTDTNEETLAKELVQVETDNNEAAAVQEQVKAEQSTQLNLDKNIEKDSIQAGNNDRVVNTAAESTHQEVQNNSTHTTEKATKVVKPASSQSKQTLPKTGSTASNGLLLGGIVALIGAAFVLRNRRSTNE